MVRMSTFSPGTSPRRRRVASSPSPGMLMSSATTSGDLPRACSTASSAVAASPTTSKSPWASRSIRTPSRKRVWSSASRTRIFSTLFLVGNLDADIRAGAGPGGDLKPRVDEVGPLPHPLEPDPGGAVGAREDLEPAAIVPDGLDQLRRPELELDGGGPRGGMLGDVADRLLQDAEERRLHRTVEAAGLAAHLEAEADARRGQTGLGEVAQGRDQPEVVERRGPEIGDDPADLAERAHALRADAVEPLRDRFLSRGQHPSKGRQMHQEGRDRLRRLVVELAGQAVTL